VLREGVTSLACGRAQTVLGSTARAVKMRPEPAVVMLVAADGCQLGRTEGGS
jgi:hypothetical protein